MKGKSLKISRLLAAQKHKRSTLVIVLVSVLVLVGAGVSVGLGKNLYYESGFNMATRLEKELNVPEVQEHFNGALNRFLEQEGVSAKDRDELWK